MNAIVYKQYGTPEVLELKGLDMPVPKDNEVLVKVYASSINSWDWDLLRGKPRIYRLLFGLFRPKYKIIGADVAGKVEAIGKNVKLFKSGDEVFGDLCENGWGGYAEYVCAQENTFTLKPALMSFNQAAAIPQAAVLAWQGLTEKMQLHAGQKILINGAGGGVGTFAVQIARYFGAEVTAVDKNNKLDMLRSVGADHVIDYTKEDFTRNNLHYDLILDVIAHHSVFDYKRVLSPEGRYVMIGGSVGIIFQVLIIGSFLSLFGKKKLGILVHKPNKGLDFLNKLFTEGKVVPVIDSQYQLSDIRNAFQHFGTGDVKGKVVISVCP